MTQRQISFAEPNKYYVSIRVIYPSDAAKSLQYKKKSLDAIRLEQEVALLKMKFSKLESQTTANNNMSAQISERSAPLTPPLQEELILQFTNLCRPITIHHKVPHQASIFAQVCRFSSIF